MAAAAAASSGTSTGGAASGSSSSSLHSGAPAHADSANALLPDDDGSTLRTCTPTNLMTRPISSLMGVMVSRFQKGVPSFLSAVGGTAETARHASSAPCGNSAGAAVSSAAAAPARLHCTTMEAGAGGLPACSAAPCPPEAVALTVEEARAHGCAFLHRIPQLLHILWVGALALQEAAAGGGAAAGQHELGRNDMSRQGLAWVPEWPAATSSEAGFIIQGRVLLAGVPCRGSIRARKGSVFPGALCCIREKAASAPHPECSILPA